MSEILEVLNPSKPYVDYAEFFSNNREIIYDKIIKVFERLCESDLKDGCLKVTANISGKEWKADFDFAKEDHSVLKTDLLPYFENKEDYEICDKILRLEKEYLKSA